MGELFKWDRFYENIPKIVPYLSVTFSIVIAATVLGVLLGIVIALINMKKVPVLHQFLRYMFHS